MEIILLLMALGATPFGAALLDKPTRMRFKKYAKAHIKAPAKPLTMAEALRIEPRNKDWKADTALQIVWQEAFNWWSIPNRDSVMKSALAKEKEYKATTRSIRNDLQELEESYNNYHSYGMYERYYERKEGYKNKLRLLKATYEASLSTSEVKALILFAKYGTEIYYGNDLVRLSAQEKLPQLDYLALTAYTSK